MKFTFSWLKDHLETEASLEEIAEKLSMLGLELEGVENPAEKLAPFVVGYVIEASQHPNADRLRVCRVETGSGEVQVVCGAPNARTGMYGVFAAAGSYVPGTELLLKSGQIRGVDSNGMLLSERELGLSDEHEGIIDLAPDGNPGDLKPGLPIAPILGLDDPVIDVAITPNRSDCLGVRGVARDLAAAGLGKLKPLNAPKIEGTFESPLKWVRDLPADLQEACPYVAGRSFRGVKNGPSPAWMQKRLKAIGLRPISALVDITNYVTFDLGRPLHVFDADKVEDNPTMRMAREGEEVLALDGRTYRLDPSMTVIADENGIEGIGGIMGGELSGCTEETTNVFLEVALFDPVRTAASGRKLGIISDARYRFERGLDPESARWGPEVAARLMLELCGGEASAVVSAGEIPDSSRSVTLRESRCESLGGVAVPAERQAAILEDLGFQVTGREGGTLTCSVPSWRPDIVGEADLVEEVLRIQGYDDIPVTPLPRETALPRPALTDRQRRASAARNALCWAGLNECVTYSFIDEPTAALFGWDEPAIKLDNPISTDLVVMRPSVLTTLLQAAQRNADRGHGDVGLFEIGPLYQGDAPEGQDWTAAVVRSGESGPRHWNAPPRPRDAFDAKADAIAVLEAVGAPVENLQVSTDAPHWYHPGRSGQLRLGPKVLAAFGEVHPRILRRLDLKGPVVACEVFLEQVPPPKKAGKLKAAADLAPFQPVERDFAFVVDEAVPAEKVLRATKGADKALIAQVDLFDVFRGAALGEGKKSLALAVTLQPREATLTEEALEAVSAKIVAQVEKHCGGTLRG